MTTTVDRGDWLDARRALLRKEKELTRLRDEVATLRRALPRVRIDKPYVFTGVNGRLSLADLFAGRSQLIVYHFMLGPDWNEPCKHCSFWAEHHDATRVHLAHRDVELAVVSRAHIQKIALLKHRFGWQFPWVSSLGGDFNFDFGVSFPEGKPQQPNYNFGTQTFDGSEAPGISVFQRDEDGAIFHTYSTYSRGLDALNGTYQLLDLVPKGRDEASLEYPMAWVRLKDRYDAV